MGVISDDLGKKICDVLGISVKTVTRVVIDLEASKPIKVTVYHNATDEVLEVDWEGLADAQIEHKIQ